MESVVVHKTHTVLDMLAHLSGMRQQLCCSPTSTQDSVPRWQGMPSSSFSNSWVSCLYPPMASVTALMATMIFTTPSGIVPIVSDCVTYPTLTFSLHPSHTDFSFPQLRKFPPTIPSA